MKKHYSAGIVLYRKKDEQIEYLLLHYISGHWDLPKGHIEEGESKQQAALRELKEETDLEATIEPGFQESFSYNFTDYDGEPAFKTVDFFVGLAQEGDVKLSHEHKDFVWLQYESAHQKLTYQNAKDMLIKADSFINKKIIKE